jgi:uncharacterized membrane protein YuzA (DUF378 family)
MFTKENFDLLVHAILIAAAINWGLVAFNGTDLVAMASVGSADIEKYTKYAIGAAGVYALYVFAMKFM